MRPVAIVPRAAQEIERWTRCAAGIASQTLTLEKTRQIVPIKPHAALALDPRIALVDATVAGMPGVLIMRR
jgi:hypothetical protein